MLYFDGDIGHFEQQIRAGIANVILNQMMYGSGVGSQIKNNALFSMPEWYMNGLIEFIAEGWNTEIDNIVRDDVLNGRYKKFNRLTGIQAASCRAFPLALHRHQIRRILHPQHRLHGPAEPQH